MSASRKLKVAIVGAGVVGLSAALHLTERFSDLVQVHLIADKFSPDTTSDKTGMLLMPFDLSSNLDGKQQEDEIEYQERLKRWTRATFARFDSLYRSEINAELQFCLRFGYSVQYEALPDPWWTECVLGFHHVHPLSRQAAAANLPATCTDIWAFTTYISNCTNYLNWMMREYQANGGTVEKKKVKSLSELSDYDVVINCTGILAGDLVPEHDMKPCRGQTVLAKAPWISTFVVAEKGTDLTYIFPRGNTVVLGGTAEIGNFSEETNSETTQTILERCIKVMPSLKKAQILGGWAGLRPLRSRVRLSTEAGPSGRVTIHCYGHGGQGVVLSWGCAQEIGDIVQKQYTQKAHL